MPIYEYRCQACGEEFEKLSRAFDGGMNGVICPACDSPEVQRLISPPAIRVGGGAGGETEAEEATPSKPPVFGRKELNEALKNKG